MVYVHHHFNINYMKIKNKKINNNNNYKKYLKNNMKNNQEYSLILKEFGMLVILINIFEKEDILHYIMIMLVFSIINFL